MCRYTKAPILTIDSPTGPGPHVTALATASLSDTGDLPDGPLDTAELDDTGRSQFDNVTRINNPVIYVRLDDSLLLNDLPGNQTTNNPPAGVIPIPYNTSLALGSTAAGFRIALYDGGDGSTNANPDHTVDPSDPTFLGFAEPVPDPTVPGTFVPHLYALKIGSQNGTAAPTPGTIYDTLSDGLHNITARVQMIDPATPTEKGFGDRSVALQVTVDTVAPPVFFGTNQSGNTTSGGVGTIGNNGLDAGSDSGWNVDPPTLSDDVTNVTNPTFDGTAEADAIIRVYAIANTGIYSGQEILIAQTTALPTDGTNAFPTGRWSVTSAINMNDPRFFTTDGTRQIRVTAEDLAGNVSPEQTMFIFIDTSGPQITSVGINGDTTGTGYDIFNEKPADNLTSPTPLVYSLDINLQDLPLRDASANLYNFLYKAIEEQIVEGLAPNSNGGITLVGDANGNIAFRVSVLGNEPPTSPGDLATATVVLTFVDAQGNPIPLPDDRYTLTILDTAIVDPAGNKLDGESNAVQPLDIPTFPTGNGVPGGISWPDSRLTAVQRSATTSPRESSRTPTATSSTIRTIPTSPTAT